MKALFKFIFWITGWKVVGSKPNLNKFVLVVAPHTSNWDFFVAVAARSISDLNSKYLAKKSIFKYPVIGWFLKAIGGQPVDRSKKMKLVDQVVEFYNQREQFVMTVTPEGTRSYNANWKTGFYWIAVKAKVPIVMVALDFEHKQVIYNNDLIYPTGDVDKDLEYMKAYYRTIKGKHPEKGVR